jgi:hypothetical protein
VTPLGSGARRDIGARSSQLFESGFTGFRGFLALNIGLDGARSSQLFESGFSGFFSVGHWFR